MWARKIMVGTLGVLLATVGVVGIGAGTASAEDRPVDKAFVQPVPWAGLHKDGSVTAIVLLKCVPGWTSGFTTLQINQGDSYVSGYTDKAVVCDNRWHPVRMDLGPGFGTLHAGKVSFSSQFVVYNNDSGDPSGGHDSRNGRLFRLRC